MVTVALRFIVCCVVIPMGIAVAIISPKGNAKIWWYCWWIMLSTGMDVPVVFDCKQIQKEIQ
jgi:hypothetical protein